MKRVSLIVAAYNRPEYLNQCLASIAAADLSLVNTILIVDDCSDNPETRRLIDEFELKGVEVIKSFSKENRSIKGSLLFGCNLLYPTTDIFINLDSDAIIRKDFFTRLLSLKETFPGNLVTGFNCLTRNKDGSGRHHILSEGENYNLKKTVGGLNMVFNQSQYLEWVKPALEKCLKQGGNWDFETCMIAYNGYGKEVVCAVPSVCQHIGIQSSMGHSAGGEPPDIATDFVYEDEFFEDLAKLNAGMVNKNFNAIKSFKESSGDRLPTYDDIPIGDPKLQLPQVTLICADGANVERCIHAANISCRDIEFGAVKILSHLPSADPRVIPIRPLLDKKDYSQFVIKEMVDFVDTEFALVFQYDGFALKASAWDNEFLNWDMVGAPWKFRPEKRTSNGGFSCRSRKMMKAIQQDDKIFLRNDNIITNFAEDHVLFYIYREYLEGHHGIRIAPEDVCDKFSIEAWGLKPPANKYNGSFGFHGFNTDFSGADLPYIPYLLPNRQIL